MFRNRIVRSLEEVQADLIAAKISTDEDVWRWLGLNRNHEMDSLANALRITRQQLLEALTPHALELANRHRPIWPRRHVFDLAVLIMAAALVFLAASTWRRGLPAPETTQAIAARDLVPFEQIRPADVRMAGSVRQAGSVTAIEGAIGRYALKPIAAGAMLAAGDLSAGVLPGTLDKRSIVLLPLKAGKTALPWKLPVAATLLISSHKQTAAPLVLADAWVLAIQADGDANMAYVAVDSAALPKLAAALSDSDVFLAK